MYGVTNRVTEVTKPVTHERKFDAAAHCSDFSKPKGCSGTSFPWELRSERTNPKRVSQPDIRCKKRAYSGSNTVDTPWPAGAT